MRPRSSRPRAGPGAEHSLEAESPEEFLPLSLPSSATSLKSAPFQPELKYRRSQLGILASKLVGDEVLAGGAEPVSSFKMGRILVQLSTLAVRV